MLEVDILKVTHATEKEAKKLLPYIKDCDVYSPEAAFLSEPEARIREYEWEGLIKSDMNRTRFLKIKTFQEESDPRILAYSMKEWEYCFRSKKPFWYLERFSTQRAKELMDDYHKSDSLFHESLVKLEQGDIEEFFEQNTLYNNLFNSIISKRDQHMGTNLTVAEEQIRERYPQFKDKESLRLAVQIGAYHNIENYTDLPVRVLDLTGEEDNIFIRYTETIYHNKDPEQTKKHTLAIGVFSLAEAGILKLNEAQIEKMSFEELTQAVESISR